MNNITQEAKIFHQSLQILERYLESLINSDYYQQLAQSGFYIVEANLADALQATKETIEINQQMIIIMQTHPNEEMKSAIAKFLDSQTQTEESITDLEPYL